MQVFRYEVTDITGRELRGNIQAASEELAKRMLTDAGYRIRSIGTQRNQVAATAVKAASPTVQTTSPAVPAARSRPNQINSISTNQQSITVRRQDRTALGPATLPRETVKTPYSYEKQLHLLFAQLAELYRAGVSPGAMYKDLSDRQRRLKTSGDTWLMSLVTGQFLLTVFQLIPRARAARTMSDALIEIGKDVEKGVTLADALDRFPYLFPEDIVGTVRAGEAGGFLPDALQDIANQKGASTAIKASLRWFIFMLSSIAIVTPIVFMTLQASGDSMMVQDKAGGSLPPLATFLGFLGSALRARGWIPLLILVLIPLGQAVLGSRKLRMLRHRTALLTPFVAGRVKAEATHRFCWALENLSRAGITPNTVFSLSAATLPNLYLREQLMDEAKRMRENEPLSAAMQRTGMIPPEYVDVVTTGELVGDVPKALKEVGKATGRDLEGKNHMITKRLYLVGLIVLAAILLPILAAGYATHYDNIFKVFRADE